MSAVRNVAAVPSLPPSTATNEARNCLNIKTKYRYEPQFFRGDYHFCNHEINEVVGYRHAPNASSFGRRCSRESFVQCFPCYQLDFEIQLRQQYLPPTYQLPEGAGMEPGSDGTVNSFLFVNQKGSRCQVSHTETREGHYRSGYKFYCGKFVGQQCYSRQDSPDPTLTTCRCDGRCGPKNGCQCQDCYRLDLDFKRYCEQRLFQEIERRRMILSPTRVTTANSGDTLGFVNEDGVDCRVAYSRPGKNNHSSSGFKFYCSRQVGREGYHRTAATNESACDCDGQCGPSRGCQCRACYALDIQLSVHEVSNAMPNASIIRGGGATVSTLTTGIIFNRYPHLRLPSAPQLNAPVLPLPSFAGAAPIPQGANRAPVDAANDTVTTPPPTPSPPLPSTSQSPPPSSLLQSSQLLLPISSGLAMDSLDMRQITPPPQSSSLLSTVAAHISSLNSSQECETFIKQLDEWRALTTCIKVRICFKLVSLLIDYVVHVNRRTLFESKPLQVKLVPQPLWMRQ